MKKFFAYVFVLLGLCSKAQDVSYNFFEMSPKDTVQITTGFRFGSVELSSVPERPIQKKMIQDNPHKIGVGNFILDTRVRLFRDSLAAHDGVMGTNLSLLRSRAYIGYQYTRPTWYLSARFGYQVYRKPGGERRFHTKLFSENIPMIGFEGGYTPKLMNHLFRFRFLCEYDFDHFGLYGSGVATIRLFEKGDFRFEAGSQYDGIYGYGFFMLFLLKNTGVYFSTFQGQLPFQETRFPEQRFGMDQGFAFGIQQNFR